MKTIFPGKLLLIPLALVLLSGSVDEYKLIGSVPFSRAAFLTTDDLGNAYIINNNQLIRFDVNANRVFNFSETNLGTMLYADVSNPLKIVLFYPDFARIITLDSKLSFQSTVDFRSLGINQPLTVCHSEEGGYWVYDFEDDQLKKIDLNLQIVHSSGNLTQAVGYQVQPGLMSEDNGYIYMNNPETGILVFDRFGTYYKTIPYRGVDFFQVIGSDILFINNNKLLRFDSKLIDEKEVLLPEIDSIRVARIEQRQLYLLTNDSLKFYSF